MTRSTCLHHERNHNFFLLLLFKSKEGGKRQRPRAVASFLYGEPTTRLSVAVKRRVKYSFTNQSATCPNGKTKTNHHIVNPPLREKSNSKREAIRKLVVLLTKRVTPRLNSGDNLSGVVLAKLSALAKKQLTSTRAATGGLC